MLLVFCRTKFIFKIFLLSIISLSATAQPIQINYSKPLKLTTSLSANFGEIRPNHFHSGLDFRVGGISGAKLYAVADGFISRINISPWGYGKAIYIDHPNGQTSVYAHLDGFTEKIRKYIEAIQYDKQSFAVDEQLNPNELPVKQGDVIGYAGNSGSSFGAHLHFEIRNTDNQAPINVVTKGIIEVTDNLPPTIHQMAVFTLDSTFNITTPRLISSYKTIKKGNTYFPENNKPIEVYNPVFLGVHANDYHPNNRSKFGINHMNVYIDDTVFFSYTLNEFLFEETRYINSFIAYDESIKNNYPYVKTYIEKGNKLRIYKNVKNNGLIILNDTLPHKIHMDLFDDNGNKSTLRFSIKKSQKTNPNNNNLLDPEKFRPLLWDVPFIYETENIKVSIPEQTLYSDILFTIDSTENPKNLYTPLWIIGNPTIPLHKHISIQLKTSVPETLKHKAVIVKQNKKGGFVSVGGTWDHNKEHLTTTVREFGTYSVAVDTIPPVIKVTFKTGANLQIRETLTVTISDNLSGIASYNGYIEGKWALFDYDAKTRSLTYRFDPTRIKKGKRHKLEVIVEDGCNNKATLNTEFIW